MGARLTKDKNERAAYMREYNKKPENRKKKNEANKKYRLEHHELARTWEIRSHLKNNGAEKRRIRDLKKRYGITVEQYDLLLKSQKGVCAICGGNNLDEKRLSVDHDHNTGEVRGLLCNTCNRKLGWFEALRESIEDYLNG